MHFLSRFSLFLSVGIKCLSQIHPGLPTHLQVIVPFQCALAEAADVVDLQLASLSRHGHLKPSQNEIETSAAGEGRSSTARSLSVQTLGFTIVYGYQV